jgi:hypothetical protein
MENGQLFEKKLDVIIELLQNLLALELSKRGAPHAEIGKRLHVKKARVGQILKGVKKEV